jgi:hypothetical protein
VPRIFEKDGYLFFFHSNDHTPIHVHVRKGDGEAVFVIENDVSLRESEGLKVAELTRAETIAEENKELILQKWHDYLNSHKRTTRYENGFVLVDINGVVEIKFRVASNRRLSEGSEAQLKNIEVSPFGLHWPDLDEDPSFKGLMDGNAGERGIFWPARAPFEERKCLSPALAPLRETEAFTMCPRPS